jgi:hypothetical protein
MLTRRLSAVLLTACLAGAACTSSNASSTPTPPTTASPPPSAAPVATPTTMASAAGYHPNIDPASFVSPIDNPYLPLAVGTTWVYEGIKDGQSQRDVVKVTGRTKLIMGVTCAAVSDVAKHGKRLLEKTEDWYAQDSEGNVWYFGEDTAAYNKAGKVASREGSWQAGVDGAEPGIVMPSHPEVTDSSRQEWYPGQAQDMFWIVSLTRKAKVPYGSFTDVLMTLEWTELEPEVIDQKFYVAGIGNVQEIAAAGDKETANLVSFTKP